MGLVLRGGASLGGGSREVQRIHARAIGPVLVTSAVIDDAVATIVSALEDRRPATFAFCNAHSVNIARRNEHFASALQKTTVFNDGVGLAIACRMAHGESFPANLNGTDLTPRLLSSLPRPTRIFLLGSAPGIADRAADIIADKYEHAQVVGTQHGFFALEESSALAERIRSSGAELVLVGMGQPVQELWAVEWTERIGAVTCCIGAFLDFTAGVVTRAPRWAQRLGVEWVYRLAQEPRRLMRRYVMGNPSFLIAMIWFAIQCRLGRIPNGFR